MDGGVVGVTGEQVTFKSKSGMYTLQINQDITLKEFISFLSERCGTSPQSLRELVEEERGAGDPETTRVRGEIQSYMHLHGLTQAILCKLVGVSQSVLSQWTRGRYNGANSMVTDKVRAYMESHPSGPGPIPPELQMKAARKRSKSEGTES